MLQDDLVTVAVRPAAAFAARPRLFAALEAAFPVRFVAETAANRLAAGVIEIASDPGAVPMQDTARPVFVAGEPGEVRADFEDVLVQDVDDVDARLRGVPLQDRPVGSALPAAGRVLAAAASGAVWTRAGHVDRVRCALPELGEEEVLYGLLSARAITAVALIEFLRRLTAEVAWQPPELRAAFVFDDPNLRWSSYGYIHYERLVAHADAHGYHVAMATIPLDATWAHTPTLRLFKARADRLSLVVHGNDHIKRELLMPSDEGAALALAAQALRRIERFERRYHVRVERIMMPPHGLCSEHTARGLTAVGFDALSAIHPLPWTAKRPASPRLVAWAPAEFVGGCAVIPRNALHSTVADLALRAFLDHPMVVYGHHEDVADGLDPLAEAAERVNRNGRVRWTSVGEIALTNFVTRVRGTRLDVRPYSRRIRVDVPTGVSTISIERPEASGPELGLCGWTLDGGPVQPFGAVLELDREGTHEVRLAGVNDIDPHAVAAPAWRPWPTLRRVGTELRDRALPLRPQHAR